MHSSWRNLCSNLSQPHYGSKVQCHSLPQNIAVAALDRERWSPAPQHTAPGFPGGDTLHSMPWEAGKHTPNNQFHYRKHISKARASEICIFVNWGLDLFKRRSKAVCDKYRGLWQATPEPCHPEHHISGQVLLQAPFGNCLETDLWGIGDKINSLNL